MIFYYIRHGAPIYNPDSLTPLGKRQAEAIGKRLAMIGIDKIYSSTSNRAIETAKPLSEISGEEIELVDFANESYAAEDFMLRGEDGRYKWVYDRDEFKKLFADPEIKMKYDWYDRPEFEGYNFKKGIERVNRETDAFFEKLGYRHNREKGYFEVISPTDDNIAFFAHAGFGRLFMSSILNVPYPQYAIYSEMIHTGMTTIEFKESSGICIPSVLMYSGDGHLYKEGYPITLRKDAKAITK